MQTTRSILLLLVILAMAAGCQESQQSGSTSSSTPLSVEAAATNANGRFETGFHVLDYRPEEQFEIRVGSLDAPVAQRSSAGAVQEKEVLPALYIEHKG